MNRLVVVSNRVPLPSSGQHAGGLAVALDGLMEKRGGLWGYALSVCGVDMPKDLAHKAVKILRDAWPEVVVFWNDLEEAFKQVFIRGGCIKVGEVTWSKEQREWVEHPTKGQGCVLTFRRGIVGELAHLFRVQL